MSVSATEWIPSANIAELPEIAAAMTLEALLANLKPYTSKLHELRGFRGSVTSAANLRMVMEGSDLWTGKEAVRVQDAYSMRSTPQVIGAARDQLRWTREQIVEAFFHESKELLDDAEAALLALEKHDQDADSIQQAFRAAHTIKGNAWFLELKGITELRDGGLRIGALTTIAEVASHPVIIERYGALAQAASEVASPQLRNQGTIGGNICQRPRCWYFRGEFHCLGLRTGDLDVWHSLRHRIGRCRTVCDCG